MFEESLVSQFSDNENLSSCESLIYESDNVSVGNLSSDSKIDSESNLDGLEYSLFQREYTNGLIFIYNEIEDCYIADDFTWNEDIYYTYEYILIPNVYDDGINGLKRVKYVNLTKNAFANIQILELSYGIIGRLCYHEEKGYISPLGISKIEHLIIPVTFNELNIRFIEETIKITYIGTKEEFFQNIDYPNCLFVDILPKDYYIGGTIEVICLDETIHIDKYYYPII